MSSQLQKRLQQFEADPPPELWQRLSDALDTADRESLLSQRLSQYAETPPAGAWQRIQDTLDQSHPAKVVAANRWRSFLRYAAVVAGLAVVGWWAFSNRTNNTDTTVQLNTAPVFVPPSFTETAPAQPADSPSTTADNGNAQSEPMFTKEGSRRAVPSIQPRLLLNQTAVRWHAYPRRAEARPVANFASAQDFMVYRSEDGTAMRVPKKLFSLINCPDGDRSCRERIHALQQQMARSTVATDFVSLLEIVRQIQQKP